MLLLLQVRLEVLVPLDEALGVRLALADLLPAVALDPLQQRGEGLKILFSLGFDSERGITIFDR